MTLGDDLDPAIAERREIFRRGKPVECANCLAKDAREVKQGLWDWILWPLVARVMCNRCLHSYYYPRFELLLKRLADWSSRGR